MNSSETNTT